MQLEAANVRLAFLQRSRGTLGSSCRGEVGLRVCSAVCYGWGGQVTMWNHRLGIGGGCRLRLCGFLDRGMRLLSGLRRMSALF